MNYKKLLSGTWWCRVSIRENIYENFSWLLPLGVERLPYPTPRAPSPLNGKSHEFFIFFGNPSLSWYCLVLVWWYRLSVALFCFWRSGDLVGCCWCWTDRQKNMGLISFYKLQSLSWVTQLAKQYLVFLKINYDSHLFFVFLILLTL